MMTPSHRPTGLAIVARSLAALDSLTGRVLDGDGPADVPLAARLTDGSKPPQREARLDADAFGVSGPETAERLAAVLRGDGYIVSTGHQPILFLGPLYVVYKALTAIAVAAQLERVLGAPVVPMFWIASDDHDWLEVGRATILDSEGDLATLSISPGKGEDRRPVGPHELGDTIGVEIERLSQALPQSEFKPVYLDYIRSAYRPGATVTEAFANLLRAVLGDRGFVWLDASGEAVKRASIPFFRRMLDAPDTVLSASDEGRQRILDAGFDAPVARLEGGLPLFLDTGGGRRRVLRDGDGFRAGPDGTTEPAEAWKARLEENPGAFSPNVSSRPPLESYLLPVAATVLGPGEVAYWSQLGPLFDALDAPFPSVQPRAAWALIEPRIQRLMDRLGVSLEELADGGDQATANLTDWARPEAVDLALRDLREAVERGLDGVGSAVAESLPGLKAAVGKARKGVFDSLGGLSHQVDQETRRRLDTQIGQLRRASGNLFPDRKPQERVLSPFYHLTRYGPGLIDELAAETARWVDSSLASPRAGG